MDKVKIKEDLSEPSLLETTNAYMKMHHSPINDCSSVLIIKPASMKGNEHVSLDLFQWLPLCSLQIQFRSNERPLLSLFIWLNDCWMDSSQLIRHWQAALLLAQWPTPTKDREPSAEQLLPTNWFLKAYKTKQRYSKPVVSYCDMSTIPKHLNSNKIRTCGQNIIATIKEQKHKFFSICKCCNNETQSPSEISLNLKC